MEKRLNFYAVPAAFSRPSFVLPQKGSKKMKCHEVWIENESYLRGKKTDFFFYKTEGLQCYRLSVLMI